jgi:hypothetical protein
VQASQRAMIGMDVKGSAQQIETPIADGRNNGQKFKVVYLVILLGWRKGFAEELDRFGTRIALI